MSASWFFAKYNNPLQNIVFSFVTYGNYCDKLRLSQPFAKIQEKTDRDFKYNKKSLLKRFLNN